MSINNNQIESNKIICNVSGCLESATEKINIDAGKFGIISLKLCLHCLPLFKENEKIKTQNNINTGKGLP